MSKQLLLVEDDKNLGYILKEYLKLNNFKVELAENGEKGLTLFEKGEYDLCILDVMMPKKDGFTLAEEIKARDPSTPLIFLTAKTLKVDQLKGFKIGADDYIVKPVDEELLIARINAVIKRASEHDRPGKKSVIFTIGSYTFDPENRQLTFEQNAITLTERETDLLLLLCESKGDLLTREEALTQIWGESDYFNRRIMDVYISKLRKYLSGDSTIKIENIHGKGFILQD